MRPAHLALLVLFNVLWAGTVSAYKALGPFLSYREIVTLRFGTAALALLCLWPWLPGRAPRGLDLVRTLLLGLVVFVVGQRLQVLGNHLGSAGNSAVLMGLEPLLTSLAAALFLREHIPSRRWAGLSLGIAGLLLLNGVWQPGFHWTSLAASLIFVSSFLCETTFSILGKPMIHRASPVKILALALLAGSALNLMLDGIPSARAATQLPPAHWLLLLYLGPLCTSVGYAVWFIVIRETDVNLAALTIFVQPVAGLAIAALLLGESLHWGHLWGTLAILAGMYVGLHRLPTPATGNGVARADRPQ